MKTTNFLLSAFAVLLWVVFPSSATGQKIVRTGPKPPPLIKSWSHAQYSTQTQVLQFINGEMGTNAPAEFRVTAVGTRNGGVSFHIFYQAGEALKPTQLWLTKRFNSTEEAFTFINTQTAKEFRICAAKTTNKPQSFFVFYREIAGGFAGGWAWKLSETVDDVQKFLSREGGYTQYIRDADIATLDNQFYIFFRPAFMAAPSSKPYPTWGWVKRETSASAVDILNNGTSNVKKMMTVARIAGVHEAGGTVFYIFYQ